MILTCTSTAGIHPALLNLERSLLTLWAQSKWWAELHKVNVSLESFCIMTSMCAQRPCPFAAEGVKDRVSKTAHCLTCEKGSGLAPFLADVQQILDVALEYSSTLLCFTPSLQTSQIKGKRCQHILQLTQPSGLRPCPPCPLLLLPVVFAYCVREVHPGLAIPAQKTISQQGLVNLRTACIKLYL